MRLNNGLSLSANISVRISRPRLLFVDLFRAAAVLPTLLKLQELAKQFDAYEWPAGWLSVKANCLKERAEKGHWTVSLSFGWPAQPILASGVTQ